MKEMNIDEIKAGWESKYTTRWVWRHEMGLMRDERRIILIRWVQAMTGLVNVCIIEMQECSNWYRHSAQCMRFNPAALSVSIPVDPFYIPFPQFLEPKALPKFMLLLILS